jgi:NTE family protein
MKEKKEINLVLSGGSARGLAHIGVLSELEKHFRIKSIIGTSMGAIIGGLYAYGYSPEEISDLPKSLNLIKLVSLFKPSFKASGLTDGEGVLKLFTEITKEAVIDNIKIDFAAVSFDLKSKKSVIIDRGSLAKAMRASSSLPFIFQPFPYGKYLFVDGYIEHPLPIKFAKYFHKNALTVACSVLPPFPAKFEVFQQESPEGSDNLPSMIDTFIQTNFYSQSSTVLEALLEAKPDIYISAYDDELAFWELDEVDNFVEVGKTAAEKALEEFVSDKDHSHHRRFLKHLQESYTDFRKFVEKYSE